LAGCISLWKAESTLSIGYIVFPGTVYAIAGALLSLYALMTKSIEYSMVAIFVQSFTSIFMGDNAVFASGSTSVNVGFIIAWIGQIFFIIDLFYMIYKLSNQKLIEKDKINFIQVIVAAIGLIISIVGTGIRAKNNVEASQPNYVLSNAVLSCALIVFCNIVIKIFFCALCCIVI